MNTTLSGRQQNQLVIRIATTGFTGYRGMELNFESLNNPAIGKRLNDLDSC